MKKNMSADSILFSQVPEPSSTPSTSTKKDSKNAFMNFGKHLIKNSNLTKGQSFYLICTVIYLSFILIMTASPTIIGVVVAIKGDSLENIKPVIPIKDLLIGLYTWFCLGVLYFIAYAVPELRDRWKIKKGEKDL
ncbi:hypothetical protein CSV80_15660 [Sporosarcina sp. P12(2017)]|uniref:hypothetical protein n=1 Tax=unclassified Sporosarcina TaxID=2647733 RepID=UPI000C172E2D|nr:MULTISPECIES: hypothetical protein [unclassified Sporosarcina]PIC56265.1 hypothetical protein CSV81_15240 [Sporosarcina sp. P10]PIC59509.1 hypothetical protein CSV80_15660 [Sporosarcina sp. P12(2017)]